MTQYLSRKERRAAEKSGIPTELTSPKVQEPSVYSQPQEQMALQVIEVSTPLPENGEMPETKYESADSLTPIAQTAPPQHESIQPISRRALREAGKQGAILSMPEKVIPVQEMPLAENPPVANSELVIETVTASLTGSNDLITEPELEISFTGTNLLAEPSTQSIVLDVVPEAVSLPIEVTGEIVSTGSIAVIPESTATLVTATMDGSELDRIAIQDAVTGVISVVEPVSAISVINERAVVGVVPDQALRKGWWLKWLIGLAAAAMTAAAIWAIITILELI